MHGQNHIKSVCMFVLWVAAGTEVQTS